VAWGWRRSCSRVIGSCSSPSALRAWTTWPAKRREKPLGVPVDAVEVAQHERGIPHHVEGHASARCACLHDRLAMAESGGVRHRAGRNRGLPDSQVAAGAGVSADQGTVGLRRQPHRRPFAYASHDDSGNWFRSYGNENWEFDESGLMRRRHGSINDLPITEAERLYHWSQGRRPDDHPGLSDLGL
jgi:hypothetical protein